jgi:hypothetical protein
MDGWYGGAFFNWNAITSKTTYSDNSNIGDSEVKITNVGGGIEFGRQWLLGAKDGFVIDLNIGAGYQSAIVDADGTNTDEDIQFGLAGTGIWPRLTFAIGYAF